ncbi:MAG TPA: prolipoprotein diacylglyceryl transferase family protein [Anaerolineales bacterium]|nr:prolipoprotein diacylglyceryl transferase family protein [Anaerolineales bacterium]
MITFFRSLFAPPRNLVLFLATLWIGLALAEKRAERHGISRDALNSMVYYGLFGYLLGGRLLYVLSNYSAFLQNPTNVFSLNLDLFDPVAALVTAAIVGAVYRSRQKLPLWSTLDALTPFFAALAIGLSLSHLAAGTAFGSPTDLPWGIEMWNAIRHPTQIYELIAAVLIFSLIWFRETNSPAGSSFVLFASLTAATRLFLEAFRGDSTLIFGDLRLAQVIAWVVLAAVLFVNELIHREVQVTRRSA